MMAAVRRPSHICSSLSTSHRRTEIVTQSLLGRPVLHDQEMARSKSKSGIKSDRGGKRAILDFSMAWRVDRTRLPSTVPGRDTDLYLTAVNQEDGEPSETLYG